MSQVEKKQAQKIVWVKQQELILKKFSEECQSLAYMHDRSYKAFSRLHMNFSLPVIILSTISGTANFATNSFPPAYREYVSLATGTINLVAGIITTIAQFLKIPEMLESHRASSNDFSKLSRNIRVELSLPIQERSMSGRDFVNQSRNEMENLFERAPDLSLKLIKSFGSKYKDKDFHMPSIIDLTSVEIYEDMHEANRLAEEEKQKIDNAAKKLVEDSKKTEIRVSNVTDHLSDFMSNLKQAADQTSLEIEQDMMAEKTEDI